MTELQQQLDEAIRLLEMVLSNGLGFEEAELIEEFLEKVDY